MNYSTGDYRYNPASGGDGDEGSSGCVLEPMDVQA